MSGKSKKDNCINNMISDFLEILSLKVNTDSIRFAKTDILKDPIIKNSPTNLLEKIRSISDPVYKLKNMEQNFNAIIDSCIPTNKKPLLSLNNFIREHGLNSLNKRGWDDLLISAGKEIKAKEKQEFYRKVAIAMVAVQQSALLSHIINNFHSSELDKDTLVTVILNISEHYVMLCLALYEECAIKGRDMKIHGKNGGEAEKVFHEKKIEEYKSEASKYVIAHPNHTMGQAKDNLSSKFGCSAKTIDRHCNDILQPLNQKRQ